DPFGRQTPMDGRGPQPGPDHGNEIAAQLTLALPQLSRRHLSYGIEVQSVSGGGGKELLQRRMEPGLSMNPVGDRTDRDLFCVEIGPQTAEHLPADLAVESGHSVGALAQPQTH